MYATLSVYRTSMQAGLPVGSTDVFGYISTVNKPVPLGNTSFDRAVALRSYLRNRWPTALVFCLVASLNASFIITAPEWIGWEYLFHVSFQLWLCYVIAVRDLQEKTRTAPIFAVVALAYFVWFVRPAFTFESTVRTAVLPIVTMLNGLRVTSAGLACLLVGSLLPIGFSQVSKPSSRTLSFEQALFSLRYYLVGLWVVTFPVRILNAESMMDSLQGGQGHYTSLGQIFVLGAALPVLCCVGLLVLTLRNQLSKGLRILTICLIAAVMITDLSTGLLAQPFFTAVALLFAYRMVTARLPIGLMLVFGLFLFPFFMVKKEFRERTWSETDMSIFDRASAFVELTVDTMGNSVGDSNQSDTVMEDGVESVSSRVDYLGTLSHVIELTPSVVPYWGGETYATILWTFVPRFLYADKPIKSLGQDFGHRYGLLDAHDTITSINFAQFVELFANFGWFGITLGMALLGVLYRVVNSWVNRTDMSDLARTIVAPALVMLCNIEGDASLVLVSVLYILIFNAAVLALPYLPIMMRKNQVPLPRNQQVV